MAEATARRRVVALLWLGGLQASGDIHDHLVRVYEREHQRERTLRLEVSLGASLRQLPKENLFAYVLHKLGINAG